MTKHEVCAIRRNTEGECADTMARKTKHDDEMRSHYDFSDGVRGKYAARYMKGTMVSGTLRDSTIRRVDTHWRTIVREFVDSPIEEVRMNPMTDAEKDMLVRALPSGQIYKMHADQIGYFVRSGTFDYFDKNDPRVQEQGLETLDSLIRRGYVRLEDELLYKLTSAGFEQATEYAST